MHTEFVILKSSSTHSLQDKIARLQSEADYSGFEVVGYSSHVDPPVTKHSIPHATYSAIVKVTKSGE